MSDRYEYNNITLRSKEMAIKELNEIPEQVNAHIESFRRWVSSMHHIKCPTNADFLIKFLRVSKFDHKKAQMRLDNFCTMRSSPRGEPVIFKHFELNDPTMLKILDMKFQVPLGFNDAGEMIILIRPKEWNPDEIHLEDLRRLMFMGIDCLLADEALQINGVSLLVDMEGVSKKAFEVWSDPKNVKLFFKIMQDTLPIRVKGMILYKEPMIFDIIFPIMAFFMNDKIKSRVIRVKHDMKKAIDKIPGFDRILPKEYGGQNGTLEECAEAWKLRIFDFLKIRSILCGIEVDESKRPRETVEYLKEYSDYIGVTLGTAGTYTKFENLY